MITEIKKRDGRIVEFDESRIAKAIEKAFHEGPEFEDCAQALSCELAKKVVEKITDDVPKVEDVQDIVEEVLIEEGYARIARDYIRYRDERSRVRDAKTHLVETLRDITFSDAKDSDMMRENANIDADTAMGTMLKYGSESAKEYYKMEVLDPKFARAHAEGDIHIHDLDFYTLTTTCCQIELRKLFKDGFSTGHGYLREPNSIMSYASLAAIAIQANQNDQHGGQSICDFDYAMADGVRKSFKKAFAKNLAKGFNVLYGEGFVSDEYAKEITEEINPSYDDTNNLDTYVEKTWEEGNTKMRHACQFDNDYENVPYFAQTEACKDVERETYQAMEAFIHNLNTMHSRAGAQTPFSSINYGMDTSPEGRLVIKQLLLATEAGLGNGETPIFPVQIFKVKEGVNYNEGDPNYDLFRLAMRCSAKRLFPNFSFLDAPFNAQYYKGTPETEIAYMGCRTRVMGNEFDKTREITPGRGNLSFTSINLPRLGIEAHGDVDKFFEMLQDKLELVVGQLDERFNIQSHRKVKNMPFLMGQGVWIDSENLKPNDEVGEVLKHGSLSVGFIGLAECLVALIGKHHGESEEAQKLGLEIVGFMRKYLDKLSEQRHLNYGLIGTPAEGLSGRFVAIDKKKYGEIKGVTDREYYTNSFHIPVYFNIPACNKIELEAPYHALTNAGHISYVELDGDLTANLDAFETIIRCMKESGIGYGSINHPVDRCPECGHNGVIYDECPNCGCKDVERIRRITGYLVGTLDRFNDAKRAEEHDRVKHGVPLPQK